MVFRKPPQCSPQVKLLILFTITGAQGLRTRIKTKGMHQGLRVNPDP